MAPPTRDPERFAPVFVLGTARSFSSVVSSMLGAHPQLYGLPELKLFAYPTMGELLRSLPDHQRTADVGHRSPGLVRAVAQLHAGDQSLAALEWAHCWLQDRLGWTGAEVLDSLTAQIHPRSAVEKSPEHSADRAALDRLIDAYPRARYVHLTRHPVTCAASMRLHMLRASQSDDDLATFCLYAWYEVNFHLVELGRSMPSQRYLRVRAEDILNDPWTHLPPVAEHLGLRTDTDAVEAMLHPEVSPFARFGPAGSGVTGGNDRAFLRDPRPRRAFLPAKLDPPVDWATPDALWSAVVELGNDLRYPA